jgi:hypothetical protein
VERGGRRLGRGRGAIPQDEREGVETLNGDRPKFTHLGAREGTGELLPSVSGLSQEKFHCHQGKGRHTKTVPHRRASLAFRISGPI